MTPQTPAIGIAQTGEFGDSKFYLVPCTCGNPDDQLTLNIEAEDTGVTLHVWTTVKTPWWQKSWDSDSWVAGLWNGLSRRMRLTWQVWSRGYIEAESWTTMRKQQALNFAETINVAVKDVEEFRNKTRAQKESNGQVKGR